MGREGKKIWTKIKREPARALSALATSSQGERYPQSGGLLLTAAATAATAAKSLSAHGPPSADDRDRMEVVASLFFRRFSFF